MMPAPDPYLAILGDGPASLVTGFYAHRAGLDFQVYEASDTVGGNARTLQLGPFRFDTGAHRLHDKDPVVTATIRELPNGDLRPVHAPSQIYPMAQRCPPSSCSTTRRSCGGPQLMRCHRASRTAVCRGCCLEMFGSKHHKTAHLNGSFFYPTRGYGAIFERGQGRPGSARRASARTPASPALPTTTDACCTLGSTAPTSCCRPRPSPLLAP